MISFDLRQIPGTIGQPEEKERPDLYESLKKDRAAEERVKATIYQNPSQIGVLQFFFPSSFQKKFVQQPPAPLAGRATLTPSQTVANRVAQINTPIIPQQPAPLSGNMPLPLSIPSHPYTFPGQHGFFPHLPNQARYNPNRVLYDSVNGSHVFPVMATEVVPPAVALPAPTPSAVKAILSAPPVAPIQNRGSKRKEPTTSPVKEQNAAADLLLKIRKKV